MAPVSSASASTSWKRISLSPTFHMRVGSVVPGSTGEVMRVLKRFMRSGSPGKNELIMWRIVKPPKLTPWAMGRASPVCSV